MHIWAYTVGHFNNDLCAAMWFVFLTYYLKEVVGLDKEVMGYAMLCGQLADGIATVSVGYLSDKFESKKYGKRMPWYIFGSFIVIPTFMGIFADPKFINDPNS
jgi:GPH family glycoside/pentoside/hexuronide:cation symporter